LRREIRAIQQGKDPKAYVPTSATNDGTVQTPTYFRSNLRSVPPAATPDEDEKVLEELGRRFKEETWPIAPPSGSSTSTSSERRRRAPDPRLPRR